MINFKNLYNQQDLLNYLNEYLPDFEPQKEELQLSKKFKYIKSIVKLGKSKKLDVNIYEIDHISENDPRVTLSKEAFSILKEYIARKSLVIFKNEITQNYRLSLITFQSTWESGSRIKTEFSNPRRYSFFLGPDAKIKTPTRFLIGKGKIVDFEDLKKRFSLEVVNKEFYQDISEQYIKLVGGFLNKGKKKINYPSLLKLPSISDKSQTVTEFAVRLIGRIIFCWFLREKKSINRKSLMPKELLSYEAIGENTDYYHNILEPIFFEVLNKPVKSRKKDFINDLFTSVSYLNGGLFSPHEDDFYKRSNGDFQSHFHNTLIIPDQWFNEFFGILETYNFTIDENTSFDEELSIDPEMLGRIFENLLAEINPETGESARKSTGSYYTPRVIVDYMVDESLYLYLQEKTKIKEEKLRAIISYDLSDDSKNLLLEQEKQKIVDALEKVKILDPACGSGAFPIGTLQKIVFILQQIDPHGKLWIKKQLDKADPEFRRDIEKKFSNKELDFIRKLGIIRDCIYGIDIQPIATEISRLRCFLTLIVDEKIADDEENRGIKPLPNLDFKFVTANSLIGLPPRQIIDRDGAKRGLFEDDAGISELKELRDMFFNAYGAERDQLKFQFVQAQNRIFQRLISEGRRGHADLTTKLTTWDPFSHKTSDWFDPKWMFGIKDGFNIIIANPPYVGEKGHKDIFREIKKGNLCKFHQGRMDLFYFFFHFALNISENNGITTFITTNYFPTATGAKKLRKDFKERSIIENLANFNELKIFESAKGQHNMITILKKANNPGALAHSFITKNKGLGNADMLHQIVYSADSNTDYYQVPQNDLYDGDEYYIRLAGTAEHSGDITQQILNKLKKQGSVLKTFCNINNGLRSGIDSFEGKGVFVINERELVNFYNPKEKSCPVIKKYYKNSDVNKYYTNINSDLYVIYSGRTTKMEEFPQIFDHLLKYKEIILSKRWKEKIPWYSLVRTRDENIFTTPKIVCPQRSIDNKFGYNECSWYAGSDVFFITLKSNERNIHLKYILALINSKLYYFWLYHRGKRKGEALELIVNPLSEIPIKKISKV